MFLFIRLAVQHIDGAVAKQNKTIARLIAMSIVLNAGGGIFQLFIAKVFGNKVVDLGAVLVGNAIGFEPGANAGRIV